jgi:hypothetical protein
LFEAGAPQLQSSIEFVDSWNEFEPDAGKSSSLCQEWWGNSSGVGNLTLSSKSDGPAHYAWGPSQFCSGYYENVIDDDDDD